MAASRSTSKTKTAAKPAASRSTSKTFELVHDALLYEDGGETHDLGDEIEGGITRGQVFKESDLPTAALARGLETGAFVPAGKKTDEGTAEPDASGEPSDGEPA